MARLSAGDADAMSELYARHQRAVFTYLVRLTSHPSVAEDLLQETFIRVYRGRQAYQPSSRFRTWLFTIARHLAVDHFRRQQIAWEEDPAALDAAVASERAEHRVEASELVERLERALAQLSPKQREVILLSRFAGMDAAEVARVTDSTPGAVRVELHRALRRLKSLIE